VLAARGFIGMCFHHYLVQELFGGGKYQSYEVEEVAHTMAALWLTGICCEPEQTISSAHVARESAPESANSSLAAPKRV
jgi:hypothetical protein